MEIILATLLSALLGGMLALLGVVIQGYMAAKKDTLTASANLVAAAQAESRKKVIESVENLWLSINSARDAFSDVFFLHAIYTPDEIDKFFQGKDTRSRMMEATLEDYKDFKFFTKKRKQIGSCLRQTEILHVGPRLWTLYHAIVAVRGRASVLINSSFQKETVC